MPLPSQGHCGFPVVVGCCLFIYSWVLPIPLEDCSEFGKFVITLIYGITKMITDIIRYGITKMITDMFRFVVVTIPLFFPLSWLITVHLAIIPRRMPLVEQELLKLPELPGYTSFLLVLCVLSNRHCLFVLFHLDIVFFPSIYRFMMYL